MQPRDGYLVGLDVIRVLALILVTAQHALSLLELEEWTGFAGLSIGQFGVSIFLAVSGLLASESRRPPVPWLLQRLRRLFPAYWIVIAFSFFLAWLIGHKQFDAVQFLAQFFGIGLFTHGDNLINSPTWFVSILLVCYAGTFLARLLHASILLGILCSISLVILVANDTQPRLLSHVLTYTLASTIAIIPREYRNRLVVLSVSSFIVLAIGLQPVFSYPATALISIELALCIRHVPHFIRVAAKYSYEYYLVHGVALFGMVRFWPTSPIAAVVAAIVLAAAAAVVLHRIVVWLDALLMQEKGTGPHVHRPQPQRLET